ncbi:hypothetical protein [Streptomyces flaveolus]|uniref:hypothetical protein n=1 Tax=Streptomyces flaveolus TaxID=67297 RepID=UPI0036FBAC01
MATAIATAADQILLFQQANHLRNGHRTDLQVLCRLEGCATIGPKGEQTGPHAGWRCEEDRFRQVLW